MTAPLKVIKRDGRKVRFNKKQMASAIEKAFLEAKGGLTTQEDDLIKALTNMCYNEITDRFTETVKIYEIQNVVEHYLLETGQEEVAKAYMNYRLEKDIQRQESLDVNKAIEKLSKKDKTVVNENANKDSRVFSTIRDLTAGSAAKAIGLKMLPEHVANAHSKGELHYHDLDYHPYAPYTNCCLVDFNEMWENGFELGNAEIEDPKSIQTASAQIAQVIANVSSSQYGGVSVNRIDELLKPYAERNYKKHLADTLRVHLELSGETLSEEEFNLTIEDMLLDEKMTIIEKDIKDKIKEIAQRKTRKDIYDSMQSLEYELNTIFSANGQTPFVSLGFGLGESWFEREIQKSILEVRINGLGKDKKTAIFPKLIFALKRGVNLEKTDPNYDIKEKALECALKRMYPDILSYDKLVELTGSFKTPMGCRSFLHAWKDPETGLNVEEGRMNLGVVTLNLPRIAIEANGSKESFWEIFEERMEVLHDAIAYKIARTKEAVPNNAPILYMNGVFGKRLSENDSVDEVFKNGRATVSMGYIGLYEVATAFYGPDWETNPEAKEFTLDILRKMKAKGLEWEEKEGYHYSLYSTPSESLTDRFCRLDKEKYGSIPDITDKDYYTNSFHYDVRKKPTPFEKIDFEKDYPVYASAGFIHYYELPDLTFNPKALETIWDYAYDRIGYYGNNLPIDKCYKCDFRGDFESTADGYRCPQCHNNDPETIDVVKRLCGYLGNLSLRPAVKGRQKEIDSREKHM